MRVHPLDLPRAAQVAIAAVLASGLLAGCASRVEAQLDAQQGGGAALPAPPIARSVVQKPSQGDPLGAWARDMAKATGVPARALQAYGSTELVLRETNPACRLSWVTLAGIGRVESDHARFGGAELRSDGTLSRPIIGVALNGGGAVAKIGDSDRGALDGDTSYDRAVGPMQFIPSTWRRHGADGNGDGNADPQQIDDAALAAGRYLCFGGRDMADRDGWWSGVLSYNNSVDYGRHVLYWTNTYAARSRSSS